MGKWRRLAIRFAIALACTYVMLVAVLYTAQRTIMYPREPNRADVAASNLPGVEEVSLTTSDGETLVAWVVPPQDGRPVLLYFHGNAGNLGRPIRLERFRALSEAGFGLFAVSYRGYGGSSGRPTEDGLHLDAMAAFEAAKARFGAERLVLYGESLGTGVAVRLAAQVEARAVVLEAPYVSTVEVAAKRFFFVPVRVLMHDQFRSLDIIRQVSEPLLVLHGDRDIIIPFEQGVELYNAANGPRRFIRFPEGGHEDLPRHGSIPQIVQFLDDVFSGASLPEAQVRTVTARGS